MTTRLTDSELDADSENAAARLSLTLGDEVAVAQASGLRYLDLPPEVDLGDPGRAALYASASVWIPRGAGRDSIRISGAPILYALSIPTGATNIPSARAFTEFLFGPRGREILTRNGFTVLDRPLLRGDAPSWLRTLTH